MKLLKQRRQMLSGVSLDSFCLPLDDLDLIEPHSGGELIVEFKDVGVVVFLSQLPKRLKDAFDGVMPLIPPILDEDSRHVFETQRNFEDFLKVPRHCKSFGRCLFGSPSALQVKRRLFSGRIPNNWILLMGRVRAGLLQKSLVPVQLSVSASALANLFFNLIGRNFVVMPFLLARFLALHVIGLDILHMECQLSKSLFDITSNPGVGNWARKIN
mmetsp:Transcript_919/g.1512  ORF Transcript_919/g.1512 Transcript_919/m.1512 type:complete len:214 (+) Transcript_919:937-1578(+)